MVGGRPYGEPGSVWGLLLRWVRRAPLLAAFLVASIAVACTGGGGDDGGRQATPTTSGSGIEAVVVSSDLAVGQNRFALGLLDEENEFVNDARVHLKFFKEQAETSLPAVEADAVFRSITERSLHPHEGGELHEHVDVKGIYVAEVTFESAGPWRFTADVVLPDGTTTSVQDAFQVQTESQTPAVGSPAPKSDNPTLSDVADISKIDSSDPPRVLMHTMSIAEAVATGKPVVVAFATPAFCQSRVCGPAMEIMDQLYDKYKDRAVFVHVEPYELDVLRQESRFELTEATHQWNLPSEPWIFVIDRKGLVAAKFEGIAALEEIEGALQPVLAEKPSG